MSEIPPIASEIFSHDRLPLAQQYAEILATVGSKRGLIGPKESPRIWNRHILNCALLADILPAESDGVDIGSGAGLPGIPLAIARTDITITLLEPLLRRVTFLHEVVEQLHLSHVTVVRGRAEDLAIQHHVGKKDFVTSRAVAPLGKLAQWSAPYAKSHGLLVALKGVSAAEEITRDAVMVGQAGWRNEEVVHLHREYGVDDTFVIRAQHI